ncbi:MAG: guanylate kinase [Pseudomonadota bacterium]
MTQDVPNLLAKRQPLLFVLSSPSGAGKSTLSRMLLETQKDIQLSVSATTRQPRSGEVDGQHYHFLDKDRFEAGLKEDAFLEYAQVHGNLYGTLKSEVDTIFKRGKDVLFDIDWQGTQQIRGQSAGSLVSIFILPPSLAELERRLRSRAQDSDAVVDRRMAKARDEISHWAEYDYVLMNDDLDVCFAEVCTILDAERKRAERRPGLKDVVRSLMHSSGEMPGQV